MEKMEENIYNKVCSECGRVFPSKGKQPVGICPDCEERGFKDFNQFVGRVDKLSLKDGDVVLVKTKSEISTDTAHDLAQFKEKLNKIYKETMNIMNIRYTGITLLFIGCIIILFGFGILIPIFSSYVFTNSIDKTVLIILLEVLNICWFHYAVDLILNKLHKSAEKAVMIFNNLCDKENI